MIYYKVNKSISIPKSTGSMLATNQTKKLVLLEEKEVENLKKEEKLRQEQEEEEKRKKRYKRRNSSQTDNTSKDNTSKEKENTNKILTSEPISIDIENELITNDPSSPSQLETPKTPIHNNSPISIDSDSDSESVIYTPKTPVVGELSPSLPSMDIDFNSIYLSNDNAHETIENDNNNISVTNEFNPQTYLNSIIIDNKEVHLETLNLNSFLWEKEDNMQEINKIMNSNSSLQEEANKIINKYFTIDDDDKNDLNINDNKTYKKSIYCKIYNHYKMNPEQQSKTLKFNFNYFPSVNEKYPAPINNIINLTEDERKLYNQYKKY